MNRTTINSPGSATAARTLSTRQVSSWKLVEQGFDTLINHNDTAVKVLVHP